MRLGRGFFAPWSNIWRKLSGRCHAFIAEFVPPKKVRTLSFWSGGTLVDNIEFDLVGTPCEEVINGGVCFYPRGVQDKFPDAEPGIQSYLGAPLRARDGRILGHLCAYDESPLPDEPRTLELLKIFATRAAAELHRLALEQDLRDKEDRLRDLFDEAPIAYVHETLDSRFLRANRAAMRILGITPGDVPHMVGKKMAPDTPDAQRRMREAFESIGKGTDASGVVLELRRKDNGKPIWIEWWSNPDPSGTYTRTMFIDITDRVLLEQEQVRLKAQNVYLQEELKSVHNFEEIVGSSPGLMKVLESVERVAPTGASVLITGESGTGKELIARAIHGRQPRRQGRSSRSTARPSRDELVESELFGHERGAFTGAMPSGDRPLRAGERRHALPRRDRRGPARGAGQAPARPAGARVRARRRQSDHQHRRAGDRGHQPRPEPEHPRGKISGRPLLQAERVSDPYAAAA